MAELWKLYILYLQFWWICDLQIFLPVCSLCAFILLTGPLAKKALIMLLMSSLSNTWFTGYAFGVRAKNSA